MTTTQQYLEKRNRLATDYEAGNLQFRLAKSGMSTLLRYGGNARRDKFGLMVDDFNHVLSEDPRASTFDVEGLATIETVVEATMRHGLLPRVSPELKHITVGGAIVGIGIESSCFLHGFFHNSVLQAEALLPTGQVVS